MRQLDRTCALCGGILYRGPAQHPAVYCCQFCEDKAHQIAAFKAGLTPPIVTAAELQPLAVCHYCEQPATETATVEEQAYCRGCYGAMAADAVPLRVQLTLDRITRECADDYLYILATVPSRRGTPLKELA